ncbi:MAG: bifunctional precorrin-2 dehydrogenase/sirohydrochlorin ferrochelatase [Magnetococcus sp. WYHC-3]
MKFTALPLMLDLADLPCLLVGPGPETERKGEALLAAGAQVTLSLPHQDPRWEAWAAAQGVRLVVGALDATLVRGHWLVVADVEDEVQAGLLQDICARERVFLNVVDRSQYCRAFWPAVVRRGALCVAVASGGLAPALAGWLRRRIEALVPQNLEDLAGWMASQRSRVAMQVPSVAARGRLWRELLDNGLAEQMAEQGPQAAATMLEDTLTRWRGLPLEATPGHDGHRPATPVLPPLSGES